MSTRTRIQITLLALLLGLAVPGAAAAVSAPNGGGATAPGSAGATGTGGTTTAGSTNRQSSETHARYRGPSPVLVSARCFAIAKTRCSKHHLQVQATGELVIGGRHFKSVEVYFPSAGATSARVDPLSRPLRPTRHGWAVTVPATAASGRIYLESVHGARSRSYGPITVLPAPVTVLSTQPAPGPSAFDGEGMWIWYLSASDGDNLAAIAAQAKQAGISTLFIKSGDGTTFWSQFTPTLVQTLHSLGLRVCGWQYVYGANPAAEAAVGAQAVADGADCLVIDAEAEYEGNYYGAQTYVNALRAAIGPSYPLGLTSFPYVNYHESEPYSVFLGPNGAQYNLPQIYWKDIGTSPDAAYTQTLVENRIYGRPIVPVGQSFGGVSAADITRFRQLVGAYDALGFSWWSWQSTAASAWTALEAPPTQASGITVPTAWPALTQGSRGDQVVWMQEHLAAVYPSTPTSGSFDATTQANLEAFQAAHGIPPSGVTDAATWTALLVLNPVVPTYLPPPPSGNTGSSGSTGSSGPSGPTGASGSTGTSGTSGPSGTSGASGGTSA